MSNDQSASPEVAYKNELDFLSALAGARPPGWKMTPKAVVTFLCGTDGEKLKLKKGEVPEGVSNSLVIEPKFVGSRALIERCVVTLAGQRGLLLVGEPGTAKSMISELLAAAISRSSASVVQGTAGTTEEQLRYGWNYAMLIAKGPIDEALVPSPVLGAMKEGRLCRIEEVTRCLPEVQDALVSILSERRVSVPELSKRVPAQKGFNIIATTNLRDRGVSEMSAALKRRFNFETVGPIDDAKAEIALIKRQAIAALEKIEAPLAVDDAVLEALVTVFRDLRAGQSAEGWAVEKPETIMSTAEAVGVATSIGIASTYLSQTRDPVDLLPGYLLGVVLKDEPKDRERLLTYWDSTVKRRSEEGDRLWGQLYKKRDSLLGS